MPLDEKEAMLFGEITANIERCFDRIKKLEDMNKTLYSLATSVEKMVDEVKRINTRLGIVENDTKELSGKSGKRWDSLVDKAIWLLAGALLTYTLKQIGIGG